MWIPPGSARRLQARRIKHYLHDGGASYVAAGAAEEAEHEVAPAAPETSIYPPALTTDGLDPEELANMRVRDSWARDSWGA